MTAIFFSLLEITVTMSVVILFLLFFSAISGHRYKARTRYIVWVIVLVRLCIPLGASFFPAVIRIEIPTELSEPEIILTEPETSGPDLSLSPLPDNPAPDPSAAEHLSPIIPDSSVGTPAQDEFLPDAPSTDEIIHWTAVLWLGGAVIFFLWRIAGYTFVSVRLRRDLLPADMEEEKLYRSLAGSMAIRHAPPLRISRKVHSPMLCGYFRPVIILPALTLSAESVSGILAHELTHYRRRDLWVKLICVLAASVNWFNPLVHLAASRCNREMELSCDEALLTGLDDAARVSYGNTMLEIIKSCSTTSTGMTTHFNPRKSAVRERFQGILDSTVKKRGVWMIVLVLALCILAGVWISCTLSLPVSESSSEEDVPDIRDTFTDSIPDAAEIAYLDAVETVVACTPYTAAASQDTEIAAIPEEDIAVIHAEDVIHDVRIVLYSPPDGGTCAAYEQNGEWYRFLILAYADGVVQQQRIEETPNVLGKDAFAIDWGWSHTFRYYYTIENGVPVLFLDASDTVTESDCDNDGMIEVLQQSSVFLTVYDIRDQGLVTLDLFADPDTTGIRGRYIPAWSMFEFDYEKEDGIRYHRRGVLNGDTLTVTALADEWHFITEKDGFALYVNNASISYDGTAKHFRLDVNGETAYFKANCFNVGTENPVLHIYDYTGDGTADCSITYDDRNAEQQTLLYDGSTRTVSEFDIEMVPDESGTVPETSSYAIPENSYWYTDYEGKMLTLLYDENHDSHLVYGYGIAEEYEIFLPDLKANDTPNIMSWSTTDLISSRSGGSSLMLWLNQYNYRYFRVVLAEENGRLIIDNVEHIDTKTMQDETGIGAAEIVLTDYRDLAPYAASGFINAYAFFEDILSGESEIEEYNTVIIEDYTLRFTIPLTNYSIYFDYTVKESGLDTMPVGTYHKVVRDIVDKYLEDVEETHTAEPFADVKEVRMLNDFFHGTYLWNTPAFGEGTSYPGMHNFLCRYYGNPTLSFDEYKRLASEKFGVTDFDALNIDGLIDPDGNVMEGGIGGSSCYEVTDVQSKDGMITVTIQFYADCNALLKSHKVAYFIGEDETWHGYEILEQGRYEPYGLSNLADKTDE